jgi:hypothetical protein
MKIQTTSTLNLRILTLALILLAGCKTMPPYVAVPEAVFRTEVTSSDRLALPLDEATSEFLVRFLQAGGDRDNLETGTGSDLGAAERYAGLIVLLANSENLEINDAPAVSPAFKPWLPQAPVAQVIDAREPAPPATQPLAYLGADGRYWWVFYHNEGRVSHLMVLRALRHSMER